MTGRSRSLPLLLLVLLLGLLASPALSHRIEPSVSLRGAPLLDEQMMCQTCHMLTRVASDYLCDFELLGWLVNGAVGSVCTALPDDDKEVCEELVVILLPMGVDFVRRSATPAAVCANVCGAAPSAKASSTLALLSVRDDTAECAQCELVTSWIKERPEWRRLSAPETALQACATLPEKLETACRAMVDKWGSTLQALIALDRPCDLLGACTWSALAAASKQSDEQGRPLLAAPRGLIQAAQEAMVKAEQQQQEQLQQLQDASPCDKCKMTVLEIRLFLNNKAAQNMVLNTTLMLCGKLSPYEQLCRDSITKYAPIVFDLIDKDFKPDFVCQFMRICEKRMAASEAVPLAGGSEARGSKPKAATPREEMAARLGMLLWEESIVSRDEKGARPSWFARSKQQS